MNDRLREAHPLLVPAGQIGDEAAAHVAKRQPLQCSVQGGGQLRRVDAFDAPDEREVFVHRHFAVERGDFRQIADRPLDLHRLVEAVVSRHSGGARRGGKSTREDPHRRRLARAVGAEKGEHFALLDGERHVRDGRLCPV